MIPWRILINFDLHCSKVPLMLFMVRKIIETRCYQNFNLATRHFLDLRDISFWQMFLCLHITILSSTCYYNDDIIQKVYDKKILNKTYLTNLSKFNPPYLSQSLFKFWVCFRKLRPAKKHHAIIRLPIDTSYRKRLKWLSAKEVRAAILSICITGLDSQYRKSLGRVCSIAKQCY